MLKRLPTRSTTKFPQVGMTAEQAGRIGDAMHRAIQNPPQWLRRSAPHLPPGSGARKDHAPPAADMPPPRAAAGEMPAAPEEDSATTPFTPLEDQAPATPLAAEAAAASPPLADRRAKPALVESEPPAPEAE